MDRSTEMKYAQRLLLSRMRILIKNGFYGLLLMHTKFALDTGCQTAATDGTRIIFCPKFLDKLSDPELDFVMMHEILHIVLKHCARQGMLAPKRFNVACDIVVNSNILYSNKMDLSSITIRGFKGCGHTAPNGREGYEYTAEEVYKMLPPEAGYDPEQQWDDHSRWSAEDESDDGSGDEYDKWLLDACCALGGERAGALPAFAERLLKSLKEPQTDWRTILDTFIQEEVNDYSFTPPDKRFEGGDFFLPDYNEKSQYDSADDILFMIDTSGSITGGMITAAYSEIKGAIDQFDGRLKGWLGFFDAAVVEPEPFQSEAEFKAIKPRGGGGTSFHVIFKYVREHMNDHLPASIVILTDGYAPFPEEKEAMGIPVLWLLNSNVKPPWGKVARIVLKGAAAYDKLEAK